jgi:hypothetical protein
MEPITVTKEMIIAKLCEFAAITPEQSQGSLKGQIAACKSMYEKGEFQRATQRLSELANMDPSRTGGHRHDQEAAAKLLKGFVSSIKPDKSGLQ